MFSWMSRKGEQNKVLDEINNVNQSMKALYKGGLLPLENAYDFHNLNSPKLSDADFDAKPMILLIGQYSTGKTTFIRYLLEKDFPGMRIGPEPTTDGFVSIMYGDSDGVIPGNALAVDSTKPFGPLTKFGNAFLNRLQCSVTPSPVLRSVTIIDTPGVLSGEKQRVDRGYDFVGVLQWFAERVDRIILLFDAHKLDISDDLRRCIDVLKGYDEKIRIVLNKADMVDHQQLMRVYGALMWSLGKVMGTPEVSRVYLGSFWSEPLRYDANRKLFESEEQDLFSDLQSLPRNAALRKINDLIKRSRSCKVHAYIIAELKKNMPSMFGKDGKKKELIAKLGDIFKKVQQEYQISPGDFPKLTDMQSRLEQADFSSFSLLKMNLIKELNKRLDEDIPRCFSLIPKQETGQFLTSPADSSRDADDASTDDGAGAGGGGQLPPRPPPLRVRGGAFDGVGMNDTPFGVKSCEGVMAGAGELEWPVDRQQHRHQWDARFAQIKNDQNKVTGLVAKTELSQSKLPNSVLGRVWKLADVDKDGCLDDQEFPLAMYLIQLKLEGNELPDTLPHHLVPPSKRDF